MGEIRREKVPDEINFEKDPKRKIPDEQIVSEKAQIGEAIYSEGNAEVMEEFEEAMVPLVMKLKTKIEDGYYDALLSDESGGRIPTLVLREIIKREQKDKERKIDVKFLGGGKASPRITEFDEWNDDFQYEREKKKNFKEHVKKMHLDGKKVLVVTEYVSTGEALDHIAALLRNAGAAEINFAAVVSSHDPESEYDATQNNYNLGSKVVSGVKMSQKTQGIIAENEKVSGIGRRKGATWLPQKTGNQEDINKSREDIKLMVQKIIDRVWIENK